WFKKALEMLQSHELGPRWQCLLEDWAKFERKHGFTKDSKLTTNKRPTIIGQWIQRARSPTWNPPIANVTLYGDSMASWWTAMQPKWRLKGKGYLDYKLVDGDWTSLALPGQNGLLSFIAGLYFW
ncbi:hypothetical protein CPC08DRAFT_618035, partial [Agrocybe pediades]